MVWARPSYFSSTPWYDEGTPYATPRTAGENTSGVGSLVSGCDLPPDASARERESVPLSLGEVACPPEYDIFRGRWGTAGVITGASGVVGE